VAVPKISLYKRLNSLDSGNHAMAGSHVETRDVLLLQRTQKELDIVRNELEKLRSSHRAVLSQLFDANHRGHQLANALGFSDIYQAQGVVGTPESHREITYQAAIERAEEWERDLKDAKEENQSLKVEMKVIEEERDDLKRQLSLANQDKAQSKYVAHTLIILLSFESFSSSLKQCPERKYTYH
jgi:hypothetical protein